jgi:hypothetical protein
MASEDTDQLLSGCPSIHRLDDLRDFNQTIDIEMPAVRNHSHATRELLEIALLRRPQRVGLEERYYRPHKILPPIHDELSQVLTMVVVARAHVYPTCAEEAPKLLKRRSAADALRHYEPVRHLIPDLVASAVPPTWLPDEPDGEATLSVYKASNPAKLNQSFLLIVCTRHIVTVPPTWDDTRSAGYSDFPAYSQMLTVRLPVRRAAIYLRTVPDCYYSSNTSLERSAHF